MKAQSFPDEGLSRTLTALGLPSSPAQQRKRVRLFRRRLLFPAGALTLFLAFVGYGWLYYIDIDPNIPVPMPTMPQPNAYDTFRIAGQAVKESAELSRIGREERQLAEKRTEAKQTEEKRRATLGEKFQLVQKNRKALDLVRQGLSYTYQEPPVRSRNTLLNYFNTYRALAYLLAFEGELRAELEEWGWAVNSGLDAMQLGTQIQRGSPMIGKSAGIASESIGRQVVWKALPHLNAQETEEAARRLENITEQRPSFADTLEEEKWIGIASLQTEILTPGWRGDYSNMLGRMYDTIGNDTSTFVSAFYYIRLLPYSKRQIVENYRRGMDQERADALIPTENPMETTATDPVSQLFLAHYSTMKLSDFAARIQNAMLRTALALHAYRLEKGVYPDSLDQLVPRYMQTIPADPFASDSPFISDRWLTYKRTEQTYRLYSRGPNRRDDGGVPMKLSWENSGDIVAGQDP